MAARAHVCFALLGAISMALSFPVAADVVRCVADDGSVTYTNLPCDQGKAPGDGNRGRVATVRATSWEAREGAAVRNRLNARKMTPDAATIATAKTAMLAHERASSFMRQQNLVALDLRSSRWFDFR